MPRDSPIDSILEQFRLDGQVALVVGGNRGLGIEMAKALAEAGASIFIAARDAGRNDEACGHISNRFGARALPASAM